MKVAILCDNHIGCRNDNKVFLDHQEKFFTETFFPKLKEEEIDTILHLGDVFDRRKFINFNTLYRARNFFFDPLKDLGIQMHVILGNHDTYFTTTNEVNSPSLLLGEYDNIQIYKSEPKELSFGDTKIILCPWLVKETYEEILEKVLKSDAQILMGHFDIVGFEMMKGVVSKHGIDHRKFSQFESVYSGHYHHPSKYGNIRYLGTQYEMNWSDYDSVKGFYLLDTQTRELEFYENPTRIYHEIDYDDTDLTVEDLSSLDMENLKNCFIKVIVKNRTNYHLFDMFMEKLNNSGAADIKTVEDTLDLSSAGMDGIEEMIDEVKNTRTIMHQYVDSIETQLAKEKVKDCVDNLYQKAMNT